MITGAIRAWLLSQPAITDIVGQAVFVEIAQRLNVLVAVKRVVVEIDLGIEADDLARLGHDQRIDLEQAHILGDKGVVEAFDHLAVRDLGRCQLVNCFRGDAFGIA